MTRSNRFARGLVVSLSLLVPLASMADTAGGLSWTPPAKWQTDAPKPMRAATYKVEPAAGDTEPGECAVFYFGHGQGGDVDANIKRWIGQFSQPDGKPSESLAKTAKKKVNGLSVTTIDLSGTYNGSMGPGGPMSPTKVSKPGYRMLGGIVEGPQGPVFFKLTGPTKTTKAAEAGFDKLLASVKTQ